MANGYNDSILSLQNLNENLNTEVDEAGQVKKIADLQIDISEIPAAGIQKAFTVVGEVGAKFTINIIKDGTINYYNFSDQTFSAGHVGTDNNLIVTMNSNNYYDNIAFPSGGSSYTIKLIAFEGTEINGTNKRIISKSITQSSSDATVTFTAITANTSNYATFPTTTSTGALTDRNKFVFDWDITNASTDAGGFGLRLTGSFKEISEKSWYFTTTETVDGAISPGDANGGLKVQVDDLTDIGINSHISAVSAGSLSGTPYVTAINTTTKTLTLSVAQTFADGITLTFIARGISAIQNATGCLLSFGGFPIVIGTALTKTVRADVSASTTVTLTDTHGVAGGNVVTYTGVGVNNSASNRITSVTPDCPDPSDGTLDNDGSMVVELAQTLTAGTVLTFGGTSSGSHKVINFKGGIKILSYPSANKTIYLEIDPFITVGAAS